MEPIRYLLDIEKFGKKSFPWWTDEMYGEFEPEYYMGFNHISYDRQLLCIRCPKDRWFTAIEVATFLNRCRKAWGKDDTISKAHIITDKKLNSFLVWSVDKRFWRECQDILKNWESVRPAKIIQLRAMPPGTALDQ